MGVKEKLSDWVSYHKTDIIYGCYILACVSAVVLPVAKRVHRNHIEAKKSRMIYDRSLGFYWEVKRNLTNNQKMAIEHRHRLGEPYGKILREMNLLKK